MVAQRLRALAGHLGSGGDVASGTRLAITPTAKAAPVVTADLDEAPAEMSDTEKFLWDLQGVSPVPVPTFTFLL